MAQLLLLSDMGESTREDFVGRDVSGGDSCAAMLGEGPRSEFMVAMTNAHRAVLAFEDPHPLASDRTSGLGVLEHVHHALVVERQAAADLALLLQAEDVPQRLVGSIGRCASYDDLRSRVGALESELAQLREPRRHWCAASTSTPVASIASHASSFRNPIRRPGLLDGVINSRPLASSRTSAEAGESASSQR
jgi:hypothetical protein